MIVILDIKRTNGINMKKLLLSLIAASVLILSACNQQPAGVDGYANTPPAKIYANGMTQLNKHNYQSASKQFEVIDALYPFSSYAEKALLQSIYAYYQNEDMASSIAAADRYVHLYPRSRRVDYAYYMKGVVNMRRDRGTIMNYLNLDPAQRDLSAMRDGFSDFRSLITLYPHSQYAADAQKRMIYIRDMLACHELQVAKFYFDRSAFVASANRASYIVQHYEGAKEVESALRLMACSYRHIGKCDLAMDAEKILKANYPETVTG